nr:unnamed protein product [Callosobruchus analis]
MTCLVLLDFSKVSNTLDPNVLCQKLLHLGFDDISIKLIWCYLENRNQFAMYNGRYSNQLHLSSIALIHLTGQ